MWLRQANWMNRNGKHAHIDTKIYKGLCNFVLDTFTELFHIISMIYFIYFIVVNISPIIISLRFSFRSAPIELYR